MITILSRYKTTLISTFAVLLIAALSLSHEVAIAHNHIAYDEAGCAQTTKCYQRLSFSKKVHVQADQFFMHSFWE